MTYKVYSIDEHPTSWNELLYKTTKKQEGLS